MLATLDDLQMRKRDALVVIHQERHHARFINASTNCVSFRPIVGYRKDCDGHFAVQVNGKWYACFADNADRVLVALDKHNEVEYDNKVFRLDEKGDGYMLTRVVRKAERVGFVYRSNDMDSFVDPQLNTEPVNLVNYPKGSFEGLPFFAVCLGDNDYVVITHGISHAVVSVETTDVALTYPVTFTYDDKTYVVTHNGKYPTVEHANTTGATFIGKNLNPVDRNTFTLYPAHFFVAPTEQHCR